MLLAPSLTVRGISRPMWLQACLAAELGGELDVGGPAELGDGP